MNTTENDLISPYLAAEMQEATENAAKGVRDPERIKRARASMDRIREEIRKKHGVLDIGVTAIRELRDQSKYVLDSSVAFKWLVPETDSDKALRLLNTKMRSTIYCRPDILPARLDSVLTRAERRGV